MKTLKNILLVIGIILGMLIISGKTSRADVKEKKSATEEQKTALGLNHQQLQILEYELIQNYLKNEDHIEDDTVDFVLIYTAEGKCVYKGEKNSAKDLIDKSDILFEKGKDGYYLITR